MKAQVRVDGSEKFQIEGCVVTLACGSVNIAIY